MEDKTEAARSNAALSPVDRAVMSVLVDNAGKVVGRETLTRLAGLEGDSARRVDTCLVVIRKVLGPDAIVTIRRRGWMLSESGLRTAARVLNPEKSPHT